MQLLNVPEIHLYRASVTPGEDTARQDVGLSGWVLVRARVLCVPRGVPCAGHQSMDEGIYVLGTPAVGNDGAFRAQLLPPSRTGFRPELRRDQIVLVAGCRTSPDEEILAQLFTHSNDSRRCLPDRLSVWNYFGAGRDSDLGRLPPRISIPTCLVGSFRVGRRRHCLDWAHQQLI